MANPKVLICKNCAREGPGIIAELLDAKGIESTVVELERQPFPDATGYAGVFVLGGPASANDDSEIMRGELEAISKIVAAGIPYFGVCLGMQALVKACGGTVVPNRVKEVGWLDPKGVHYTVEKTQIGLNEPLLRLIPASVKLFQLHGETVELEPHMELLATGRHCKNQIVRVGRHAYGVQGHFELTTEMLGEWIAQDEDLKKLDANALRKGLSNYALEYEDNGRRLVGNFLRIAGIA